MDMIRSRNPSFHTYNLEMAAEIARAIDERYWTAFRLFLDSMDDRARWEDALSTGISFMTRDLRRDQSVNPYLPVRQSQLHQGKNGEHGHLPECCYTATLRIERAFLGVRRTRRSLYRSCNFTIRSKNACGPSHSASISRRTLRTSSTISS